MLSPVRLTSVCLSVCLSLAPVRRTQPVEIFGKCFYAICVPYPLTTTENFTEIVPGKVGETRRREGG